MNDDDGPKNKVLFLPFIYLTINRLLRLKNKDLYERITYTALKFKLDLIFACSQEVKLTSWNSFAEVDPQFKLGPSKFYGALFTFYQLNLLTPESYIIAFSCLSIKVIYFCYYQVLLQTINHITTKPSTPSILTTTLYYL